MGIRPSSLGWGALAFVIGAFPAFWLAGPALFADGPMSERLVALAAYAALVFVLAIGGGALAPAHRLGVSVGMALPVLIVILLAEWGASWAIVLSIGFILTAAFSAWLGALVGARITASVAARRGR